ncbi:DUF6022 family protein [Paenibacillus apiarius]|uniref:DUF6022 family protein n=1 Tax=Paenibacillus apiarius TaxID=46240 RepID=A0ABT4E0V7_9BACL|nr:DUF6022 family protein [Paenibacillus apiarius]MBN3527346.1 hypothetical protein [Paenibacillus apiarius]MCY9517884.1 DUF6022 family protein [Paenibacillus apiarius]MCY9523115.1 DUF6022 family protein [Paenibacillus apiarius]MCY9553931.1 DUF6022 family protein [Paenibacillus apiarius]MCY9559929.1 DUF6022 family protein [Paenibacillus apiarius]
MNQAKPPMEFLQESNESRIDAIAHYIEGHISENWQSILQNNWGKLLKAYNEAGDMAYGSYLNLLFLSVHKQFKEAGLRPEPRFPGDFDISREWGNEEKNDQQRWMWSTVHSPDGEALGTIVTIVHHDHTQFRVPRQPQLIALRETGKEAVTAALSLRSADFKNAREFTVEYEEYLRSQQQEELKSPSID